MEEEIEKLKIEITDHIKKVHKGKYSDDLVDEIVKRTFDSIKSDESFLLAKEKSVNVVKKLEKENKVPNKEYYGLQNTLEKQILSKKDKFIKLGLATDISVSLGDDFDKKYYDSKDALNETKKYTKEFFSIRNDIIKILENNQMSDDEKNEKIQQLQENAKYHEISDESERKAIEFMYSTNETLAEIMNAKDLSEDEIKERYELYQDSLKNIIKANYGIKQSRFTELAGEIDYLMDDDAKKRIFGEMQDLYQEIGWQKNSDNAPEKQKLELSCFEGDNFASKDEYVDKMIEYEKNENEELKKLDEQSEKIKEEIEKIENDSNLDENEKKDKIKDLNNDLDEVEKNNKELIDNLKDDYAKRYEKIISVFSKAQRFAKMRNNFYDKERSNPRDSLEYETRKDSDMKSLLGDVDIARVNDEQKKEKPEKKTGEQEKGEEKAKTQKSSKGGNEPAPANGNQVQNSTKMPLVINTPQKAKNTITEFLNLKTSNERYDFIEEYGFETLKNAVEALSENDSGYSLSRKERKNLIKAVDETVGMKFSKSNIESRTDNKKTQIINVLNELDPKLGRDNEPLYNRLFAYNKDNLIPEIVTGKFEEKAQIRLRHMAKNYDQMLQEGELTPEQISTFENYILSPLNAGMLKKEIQNMGVLGKFKNNFSKSSKEYQKINSILDDIQTTKLSMSQGSMSNLRDGVNSDFEAARSARSRAKTEQSRTQSGPTQPEGRI